MLFLSYFCLLLSFGAAAGGLWFIYTGEKLLVVACSGGVFGLLFVGDFCGEAFAKGQGFESYQDWHSAQENGVGDPARWTKIKAQAAAEEAKKEEQKAQQQRISEGLANATLLGVQFVHNVLKDPWSASILPSPAHLVGNHIVVCGTVNAKNGFGAYTGAKLFAVYVDTGRVAIEGSDDSASENWSYDCG